MATLFPSEEKVEDRIRKLPAPAEEKIAQNLTRSGTSSLVKKEAIKPITSKRFKIEFSASENLAKKIQRAKEILRHKKEQIQNKVSHKKNETSLEMSRSFYDTGNTRYIPVQIKQTVWGRDKGQCSYVSPDGKQCGEKNFLELDHIHPWALDGDSSADNLRLLCQTHNQLRAEKTFGLRRSFY